MQSRPVCAFPCSGKVYRQVSSNRSHGVTSKGCRHQQTPAMGCPSSLSASSAPAPLCGDTGSTTTPCISPALPSFPAPQVSLRYTCCVQHPTAWAAQASAPHPGHHPGTYSSSKLVRSWPSAARAAIQSLICMEVPPGQHWQDARWFLGKREKGET